MKFKNIINEKKSAEWNTVKFNRIKRLIDKIYKLKSEGKTGTKVNYYIDDLKIAIYGSASTDNGKINKELEKLKEFSDLKGKIPGLK